MADEQVDQHYYQVARPGTIAERITAMARDSIYADFIRLTSADPQSTILDVGVSDVVGEAANVLERKYPNPSQITAVGLGTATQFQAAFPNISYRQICVGEKLPFADKTFDIATSNAVLEHVGSRKAQEEFVAELVRVARRVFISVPHQYFPIEHHTGIPFVHWSTRLFSIACRLFGRTEWTEAANLILMNTARLEELSKGLKANTGHTGLKLGPLSSNLYLLIDAV